MSEVHLVPVVNPPEPLPCHLSWYNLCGSTADVFIVEGGQYVCKKHGVEFVEAMTISGNPLELTLADPDHSEDEYAPLELYAMGLLPAAEVPPIHILHDPDLTNPERVTVASYDTVTIEDIIE
ncbi:MAG: hypothetical protein UY12_C0039G0008, partial [Parcubacteria group bacterium GW2011_GWA2_47_8b]